MGKDAGLNRVAWRRVDGVFHEKVTTHAKVSGKDRSHGHRGSEWRP